MQNNRTMTYTGHGSTHRRKTSAKNILPYMRAERSGVGGGFWETLRSPVEEVRNVFCPLGRMYSVLKSG